MKRRRYLEFAAAPCAHDHPHTVLAEIPSFFIRLLTRPDQLVVDPCGGTGTTAVAAESLGRKWLVIERERRFAKILTQRLATEISTP